MEGSVQIGRAIDEHELAGVHGVDAASVDLSSFAWLGASGAGAGGDDVGDCVGDDAGVGLGVAVGAGIGVGVAVGTGVALEGAPVEGMTGLVITGLCFCASGSTSGPFWPQPESSSNT